MSDVKPSAIHGDMPAASSSQGLADRKELASFAFQRTRMPMVIADARQADYPIVLANDAFLALTGYSAEELLGKNCRILQGEATSRTAVAQIRAILAGQGEGTVEILNYKKDGTTFWNQLYLSPIHEEDGGLAYYFASQVDVTEYRKVQTLEEAEHRLLLEVDHRTKNVLAIVDSVVRLSRSDNAAAYAASVQQRIQALSRTHILLAEKGWEQVELGDIIRTQVSIFGDQKNIEFAGPAILIPAPSVQPIGLVIHELAANAAVHGSLSSIMGSLEIAWHSDGDGVVLEWHERGGRQPVNTAAIGFGYVMLGAVVEKQLGGRIVRQWRNDGLSLSIELPSLDGVGRRLHASP